MKRCTKCGERSRWTEFYAEQDAARTASRPECKACSSAQKKAWYRKNRRAVIAKVIAWQRENQERYNARMREYRKAHPDVAEPVICGERSI